MGFDKIYKIYGPYAPVSSGGYLQALLVRRAGDVQK